VAVYEKNEEKNVAGPCPGKQRIAFTGFGCTGKNRGPARAKAYEKAVRKNAAEK
jgi:predicted naringenin-chalcone synthase